MLKNLVSICRKATTNPVLRDVATLAGGTAGGQLISVAFTPVVTRLYGPEAFGALGTFLAALSVIAPLACLSYPFAIVLPREEASAWRLARLSIFVSLIFCGFISVTLAAYVSFGITIASFGKLGVEILILPIAIILSNLLNIGNNWAIREEFFKLKAAVALKQSLFVNLTKVLIGAFAASSVALILITVAGLGVNALLLAAGIKQGRSKRGVPSFKGPVLPLIFSSKGVRKVAGEYKDFAIKRTPQIILNASTQGVPVILLAFFFGPGAAGQYALGLMVMGLPLRLIGESVSSVLYPRLNAAVLSGADVRRMIVRTSVGLAAVGVVPFGLIMLLGPWLFALIFGAEWGLAGDYARWLAIWYFMMFVARSAFAAIAVLRLQGLFLSYELLSTFLRGGALVIGFVTLRDDQLGIMLFSITSAALYLLLTVWVIYLAGAPTSRAGIR